MKVLKEIDSINRNQFDVCIKSKIVKRLKVIDDYFFPAGDEDVKPYFYGSIIGSLIITVLTIISVGGF